MKDKRRQKRPQARDRKRDLIQKRSETSRGRFERSRKREEKKWEERKETDGKHKVVIWMFLQQHSYQNRLCKQ